MLEFRQVEKRYGTRRILFIPAQTLDNGIYWLQGPNGSGKTTLLRMLAGILPFRGDILLKGQSLRSHPVCYRRLIGWADAEPLFPGFLTGEDLLNFYSGILRPDAALVRQLSETLGVRSFLATRSATWSSGMTKKIALLLAFMARPALVLLDEPLITLDEAAATALLTLIHEFQASYGASFLISSHQPLPARSLAGTRHLRLIDESISLIA